MTLNQGATVLWDNVTGYLLVKKESVIIKTTLSFFPMSHELE
jgi:hypothetical protein